MRRNWTSRDYSFTSILSGTFSNTFIDPNNYIFDVLLDDYVAIIPSPLCQYVPHVINTDKPIFDRFAVIFTVSIVWLYAYLLTVGGAYKHARPKTQLHCRTDSSGLVGGSPWYKFTQCFVYKFLVLPGL